MTWTRIVMLVMVTAFVGCDSVTSSHPVGEKAALIDVADWEGQWCFPQQSDGALVIEVTNHQQARLKLTTVTDDGKAIPASTGFLRSVGADSFLSISTNGMDYFWFRVENRQDSIVVWLPDASKFRQLVKAGALPGRSTDGVVKLQKLSSQHIALITSEEEGVLFDWKNPWVLHRVSH
jgi:hypothetical protein